MNILITGSNGLVGSEAVKFFNDKDWNVVGVDNNMRSVLFGVEEENTLKGCYNLVNMSSFEYT